MFTCPNSGPVDRQEVYFCHNEARLVNISLSQERPPLLPWPVRGRSILVPQILRQRKARLTLAQDYCTHTAPAAPGAAAPEAFDAGAESAAPGAAATDAAAASGEGAPPDAAEGTTHQGEQQMLLFIIGRLNPVSIFRVQLSVCCWPSVQRVLKKKPQSSLPVYSFKSKRIQPSPNSLLKRGKFGNEFDTARWSHPLYF